MSDHEVITEVPPQLRRLVRLVARAFFQPQHTVVLDILSIVTEGDLVEVLKMQSAQKQLRQVLHSLRKDKLVKSLQKMESTDIGEGGRGERGPGGVAEGEKHLRMVYYYYINYKQFVNVVKYKLDKMRKAIEAEEKKVQNRTSYICSNCGSTFADLDVDRLFDPTDGNLKCSHCGSVLEEDAPTENAVDSRTLISRLNDQMKPITDLLRETENINLAPEILEPEAQSIEKHLQARGVQKGVTTGGHGKEQQPWATRRTMDIYGADQAISVNIGTEEELRKQNQPVVKDRPEWMKYSTVHPSGNLVQDQSSSSSTAASAGAELVPGVGRQTGQDIIEDLLMYERKPEPGPSGMYPGAADAAEYSSSSSDEGGEGGGLSVPMHTWQTVASPMGSEEEEEDEEEEYTMKIGERVVALDEVTDEMVAQMTADEKETYTRLYQQAMSQADYY